MRGIEGRDRRKEGRKGKNILKDNSDIQTALILLEDSFAFVASSFAA